MMIMHLQQENQGDSQTHDEKQIIITKLDKYEICRMLSATFVRRKFPRFGHYFSLP
jgi:hypothetical protein